MRTHAGTGKLEADAAGTAGPDFRGRPQPRRTVHSHEPDSLPNQTVMPRPGDVIEHPVTGERMVFLQTGRETNGQLLQIDLTVQPGGSVALEHIHPHQDERFVVRKGEITMRVNGILWVYQAGEEVTVPRGTPHVWWNAGDDELNVVLEFRPAGRFDRFITSFFALAQTGGVGPQGTPGFFQMAVLFHAYRDVVRVANLPIWLQDLLLPLVGALGRMLGYPAEVPYPVRAPGAETHEGERLMADSY